MMKKRHSPIKNHYREQQLFEHRLAFVSLLVVLLAAILLGRLFFLQVIEHKKYTTLSKKNQLNTIPIEPTRGVIYDRNGVLLAQNVPSYSLELIPDKIQHLDKTIATLQQLIPSIQPDDIQSFYKLKKQHHGFEPIPLRLSLTPAEVAQFSLNQYRFPGVDINAHLIRHYPLKKTMAHVLGYVGRINQAEWDKLDQVNYSATRFIGKLGIEKHYEALLHGTVGYQQVETNAGGHVIRTLSQTSPTAGKELYLTIDIRLQKAAQRALGKNRGSVILMNPTNGEILAMVSKPSYDPNLFVQGIDHKTFNTLMYAPDKPLYNRTVRGQYPLASTIKPYLALGALDAGVVSPDYKVYDPGWFRLPNSTHRYRDWRKGGHGWINASGAVTSSCDTYFFTLSQMLGIRKIDQILAQFGFGQKTGLDSDEELAGLIPSPEWKRRMKSQSWYPGDTVSASIGQGYMLATPMQLVNAVSTLSQRGIHHQPHLWRDAPSKQETITLHDPNNWEIVIQAMHGVTSNPRGTAYAVWRNAPHSVAAKTGTAQVFTVKQHEDTHNKNLPVHLRDHSLFIAFSPVEQPDIALAIIVENCHDASIIARQIMDVYWDLYGSPEDFAA